MARILIVDDEESVRTSLGAFVKSDGHEVSLARDAAEALGLLQETPFDVVVSDIILPRRSGVELLGDIHDRQPAIQVIMITGEPEIESATEAVRKGAFDYLAKPVSRKDITKTVSAAVEKKALLDGNRRLEEENRQHREHLEELVKERTGQLHESEARYRELFTSIADPIFVFSAESLRFLDCNQSALDRYGYTREDLRGMTPHDLHLAEERELVSTNIADAEDISANSYTHITKDGEQLQVEVRTTDLRYQGEAAWISIIHDVTERRRAEKEIRRLSSAVEQSIEGMAVADLEGNLLFANTAFATMHGYSPEELIGEHLSICHTAEQMEAVEMANRQIRETGSFSGEIWHVRRDGTAFPTRMANSLLLDEAGHPTAILATALDVTDRHQARNRTDRLLRQQVHINQLALALGHATGIDEIYATVCERASDLLDVSAFIVSLYDEEEGLLHAAYAQFDGEPFDVSKLPPIPLEKKGRGTQSEVIRTGEPLYLPDFRKARERGTTEYTVDDDEIVSEGPPPDGADDIARSALLVPLKLEGRTIGVMQVQSYHLDAYTQEDIDLLAGLANVSAVAVRNAQLLKEVEADAKVLSATLDGMIQALAATVETRDPYTAGHQQRVAALACAIAEEMGVPAEQQEAIRVASLLHDIGKMSVPAEILSKPSSLSELEFSLIKAHVRVAYGILEGINFPWPIAEIVLQHHERLDGSGYPNNLKGDEILLEARTIAVADVVEAMASHRPYRPARGLDAALEEIKSKRGICFDSDVVDACVRLFKEQGFEFHDDSGRVPLRSRPRSRVGNRIDE